MSDEQTEKMREIQSVMAAHPVVAKYIKDLETAHATATYNFNYDEPRITQLESVLAAERECSDNLAEVLNAVKRSYWSNALEIALAEYHKVRGRRAILAAAERSLC